MFTDRRLALLHHVFAHEADPSTRAVLAQIALRKPSRSGDRIVKEILEDKLAGLSAPALAYMLRSSRRCGLCAHRQTASIDFVSSRLIRHGSLQRLLRRICSAGRRGLTPLDTWCCSAKWDKATLSGPQIQVTLQLRTCMKTAPWQEQLSRG
jgi:hypothetical protein